MAEYYPSSAGSDEIPQTSTLALVSLISGIVSWFIVPVIGPIVAVITGHMAKKEIRESAGRLTGDGLATAGLYWATFKLLCWPAPSVVRLLPLHSSASAVQACSSNDLSF